MRRYVACIEQELHKTANRRCCAGTHCGQHDDSSENSRGGWRDRATVGLKKKVVLEMFTKSRESWDR